MPTCPACLRAHMPTCLVCLRANVLTCLACSRALHTHVPTCLACSRANVPCVITRQPALCASILTYLACLRANVLVLMPQFSVSLPLLLKLYKLLVRFKNLITVFPQKREIIYEPSLTTLCRLGKREYR